MGDKASEAEGRLGATAAGEAGRIDGEAAADAAARDGLSDALASVKGLVGVGVDIVDIDRMRAILARSPMFSRKVFSCEECCYCDERSDPAVHYACRFAAKEAVMKALGTGLFQGVGVRDVEVVRNAKGRPSVRLSGGAARIARAQGVRELPLSLSYTHAEAVAFALAITDDSVRAKEERTDQKAELAKRFKEVRGMLDAI